MYIINADLVQHLHMKLFYMIKEDSIQRSHIVRSSLYLHQCTAYSMWKPSNLQAVNLVIISSGSKVWVMGGKGYGDYKTRQTSSGIFLSHLSIFNFCPFPSPIKIFFGTVFYVPKPSPCGMSEVFVWRSGFIWRSGYICGGRDEDCNLRMSLF